MVSNWWRPFRQLAGKISQPFVGQGLDQFAGSFQGLAGALRILPTVLVGDRLQCLADFSQQPAEMVIRGDGLHFLLDGFGCTQFRFQGPTSSF
jgi:hypothetical protein